MIKSRQLCAWMAFGLVFGTLAGCGSPDATTPSSPEEIKSFQGDITKMPAEARERMLKAQQAGAQRGQTAAASAQNQAQGGSR